VGLGSQPHRRRIRRKRNNMKTYGTKNNFTSPSNYMKKAAKPRTVRLKVIPTKKKASYKVPKTPKVSGVGWGM